MDVANKEPVHPDGETVKCDEAMESLRRAISQANDAVDDADHFRDEWVKKVLSCPCKSPSSCEEKEQETILKLLIEVKVFVSKWVEAISYALTMRRKAELIVDTLLPTIGEEVTCKALTAVRNESKRLESSWERVLADVMLVSQYTTEAVKGWNEVTLSSRGLKKTRDARSAYQAIEKVYQIAGGYDRRENFFLFDFILPHFSLSPVTVTRDVLLQLEARSFLSSILDSVGKLAEISQAEAMKNVQKAILTADEEIARMIHSIDRSQVDSIAPWIQKDKILENLIDVKNWVLHWNQAVTSAGNAIWQIIQDIDILSYVAEKDDKQKEWIEVKNGAKELFRSWYPYMYGIKKLYDHTVKADQRYLPKENFTSWYQYMFSDITEEEKKAIEAIQCIRYQFNWLFWDRFSFEKDKHNIWTQDHFTQISQNWTLFAARLLEPGTLSSQLFVDIQNQDNWPSPSLHFLENAPSLNIEQEAVRWMKARIPKANRLILQAIRLMWKWPKNKEVSLLKANESLEILKEVKNWVSDLSQVISASRYTIQEMVDALQIQSIISKNNVYKKRAKSIFLRFWDSCMSCIIRLSQNIADAEASWQDLVTSKEISTAALSLNATPVNETKVKVASSTKIHVNICVSLNPKQTYSSLYQQKEANFITKEEKKAVDEIGKVVDAARELHDMMIDHHYIQKLGSGYRQTCISYEWMLLRHDLLNL
jgi:hypothetical protein